MKKPTIQEFTFIILDEEGGEHLFIDYHGYNQAVAKKIRKRKQRVAYLREEKYSRAG